MDHKIRPEIEYLRRNQGPLGAGRQGRLRQRYRGEPFVPPANIAELEKAGTEELRIDLVKDYYDAVQRHPSEPRSPKDDAVCFIVSTKHGTRIQMHGMRTNFHFRDLRLHEILLSEENAKIVRCKDPDCRKPIPLLMKVWMEKDILKLWGQKVYCCWHCLTIVELKSRPYRRGRLV